MEMGARRVARVTLYTSVRPTDRALGSWGIVFLFILVPNLG
jgi:hypothetical protein